MDFDFFDLGGHAEAKIEGHRALAEVTRFTIMELSPGSSPGSHLHPGTEAIAIGGFSDQTDS